MIKRVVSIIALLFSISSVFSLASNVKGNKQVVTFGEFRTMFLNKPINQLIDFLGTPTQEINNDKDGRLIEVLYEWKSIDDMPIKIRDHRKGYDKYYFDKISVRLNQSRYKVDNIVKEIYFSNQRRILTDEAREKENLAIEQERLEKEQENLAREKFEQKRKADPDKISKFYLMDLNLGTDLEGFKKVFPRSTVHETKSPIGSKRAAEDVNVIRYKGGAGHGWGQITDWIIEIYIPFEEYGYGASSIKYTKILREKVDESVFQNNLKEDLIKKYGKPDLEYVGNAQFGKMVIVSYNYCWGSKCSALKGTSWPANLGDFPEGKYLLVKYMGKPPVGFSKVEFILFDNLPIYRFKEANKTKETERAKKRIKF